MKERWLILGKERWLIFLWKMVVQPFQKLVDGKLVASSVADDAKKEF